MLYVNRSREVMDSRFARANDQIIDANMTKTQKALLVTAAIAGLVAGAVAKANTSANPQSQDLAGKPVSTDNVTPNGCNGCPGHTNSVASN